MPDLPQALVTVEANPPLRPTDSPFQASVGLGALLTTLVQLSQRRQTIGLDIDRLLPQAEVIVETNNPINTALLATVTVDTNNPQGSIASRLPQSEVEVILRRFGSFSFNQGDLSSTIIVTTGQFERSEEKQLSQALVNVQTNEIQGGVVITDNLPQSTVEVGTALLIYSESNRMIQSFIEVSAFPPTAPARIRALDPAIVRVQTYAPLGQICSSVFDDGLTPANQNYSFLARATNVYGYRTRTGNMNLSLSISFPADPPRGFPNPFTFIARNLSFTRQGITIDVNWPQPLFYQGINLSNYRIFVQDGNQSFISTSAPRREATNRTTAGISTDMFNFIAARQNQQNTFNLAIIDITKVDPVTGGECRTLTHIDVDEALLNSTVNVETNLPSTQVTYHEDIPQARIDVETNLLQTGVGIPQARVDVATMLFARTFAYPMQTATVDVSANNPQALPIYVQPSVVNVETALPAGRAFTNLFFDNVTQANSDYAVIGKQLNVGLTWTGVENRYGMRTAVGEMSLRFRSTPAANGATFISARRLNTPLIDIINIPIGGSIDFEFVTIPGATLSPTWPAPADRFPRANYGFLFQSLDRLNTFVLDGPVSDRGTNLFRITINDRFRTWLNDFLPTGERQQIAGTQFNIALIDTTKTNLDHTNGDITLV